MNYRTITRLWPEGISENSLAWTKNDPYPQVDAENFGYAESPIGGKSHRYATSCYSWTSDKGELVQRYELVDTVSDCTVAFAIYVENKFYLRGYNPEEINSGRLHFWHSRTIINDIRIHNVVCVFRANGNDTTPY